MIKLSYKSIGGVKMEKETKQMFELILQKLGSMEKRQEAMEKSQEAMIKSQEAMERRQEAMERRQDEIFTVVKAIK